MATARTTTQPSTKYVDLIQKSKEEVNAEMLPLEAEKAKNILEQGILSVKSQLLEAQGQVKRQEIAKKDADSATLVYKSARPFNVQNILDARAIAEESANALKGAKDHEKYIKETLDYLESLKTELF